MTAEMDVEGLASRLRYNARDDVVPREHSAKLMRLAAEEIERLERASMEEFQPENQRLRDQVFTLTRRLQEAVEERDRLKWERDALEQMMEYIRDRAPLEGWAHECANSVLAEVRKQSALTERSKS